MAVQTQIQVRRGTASSWTSTNPTLAAGEIGYETDTGKFKIGTGAATWTSLTYFNPGATASPLTTKGDIYTRSSTADTRLPVGADGYTLVADSSQTTGLNYGFPNTQPVINGGFDIWQRGTSISVSASTTPYIADRWQISTSANQASTVSRQATNDTTNLPSIQYCARIQRNSGQTGTGVLQIAQNFETINSIPFAGKTVTLSFYARAGANFSATSSALSYYLISGTGTDQNQLTGYTGQSVLIGTNATLTTTWQRFTTSVAVGATATELSINFQYSPTGTASTNDYFEITGVQIDLGSTALPFRRSGGTIQGELAACQRYYYKHNASGNTNSPITNCSAYSTTNELGVVTFPVTMRTAPTLAVTSGTNYYTIVANGGLDNINSFTQDASNANASTIYNNTEVAQTAGHAGIFICNNASSSIAWSAEL